MINLKDLKKSIMNRLSERTMSNEKRRHLAREGKELTKEMLEDVFGNPELPTKSFHLFKSQTDAFGLWRHKHKGVCTAKNRGAVGGGDKWIFMPTGVGMVVKYICACGEGIDLTEINKW